MIFEFEFVSFGVVDCHSDELMIAQRIIDIIHESETIRASQLSLKTFQFMAQKDAKIDILKLGMPSNVIITVGSPSFFIMMSWTRGIRE